MTETTQTKPPSHDVLLAEGEGETTRWTRIGAAWTNKDGEGFNIKLSCIPLDGRLVLRKRQPKQQQDQGL